ncbi:MAG: 30S ribosomal protein S20 [bacterium]|nr:30S ribosomal protein S20 [Candidatus Jorgensenbacteria bacterium]
MPRTKSAKKALRQTVRRREQNLIREKKLKDTVKKFKKLVVAETKADAQAFLKETYKTIDKMAKVNFIKKGKANRMKSRLAKKLKVVA